MSPYKLKQPEHGRGSRPGWQLRLWLGEYPFGVGTVTNLTPCSALVSLTGS
jgi:hypothetical protein